MFCNSCGVKLEEDALFCSNCGTRVSMAPQAADEEEKTILLTEEVNERTENVDVEAEEELAVPHETAEKEQAAEPEQETEEEQTEEQTKEQAEEQAKEQTEEPQELAVEKVEAVEILPTGMVETTGTTLVQAVHIEQKKFCPNCGSENGVNDLFCHACGMSFVNADQAFQGTEQKKPKNNMSKKSMLKIIVPIAAVAAVAVIALGIVIVPGVLGFLGINVDFGTPGSRRNQKDFVLYIKDNELNFAKGSKFEPVLIGERVCEDKDDINSYYFESLVKCTSDNKYIYYPHDFESPSFDLYRKKLGDSRADEEKIDSNVIGYQIIGNDKVAYIKDSTDRRLYLYDKGEAERIASDVSWVEVSTNEKYLLWMTSDGDRELYIQDIALKEDKIKLDSDVYLYDYSDNFDTIVYEKNENLYVLKDMEDKEKIASDVEEVYVYGINNDLRIYYMKEGDEIEMTLYDLVEDDYLAVDENMQEPRIEDYQTVIGYNYYGDPQTKTSDSYYEALNEYEQKLMRDEVRTRLKEDAGVVAMEIYYYDNDESDKVMEALPHDYGNLGTDTALMYLWTMDYENFEGPKLSRMMENYNGWGTDLNVVISYGWEEAIFNSMDECVRLQYIKNGEVFEVSDIGIDGEKLFSAIVAGDTYAYADEKTHTMYLGYDYSDASTYSSPTPDSADYSTWSPPTRQIELYSFDYNASDPDTQLISDEVGSIDWMRICDEGIFYINVDDELYCNDTKIDSDVYVSSIRYSEDGKVLYLTDISKNYNEGTLKQYQNGETVKIANDVAISQYYTFDGNKIAFLSDYNFNKSRGDLKVYNGKETIKVDTDVTMMLFRYN